MRQALPHGIRLTRPRASSPEPGARKRPPQRLAGLPPRLRLPEAVGQGRHSALGLGAGVCSTRRSTLRSSRRSCASSSYIPGFGTAGKGLRHFRRLLCPGPASLTRTRADVGSGIPGSHQVPLSASAAPCGNPSVGVGVGGDELGPPPASTPHACWG